MREIKFRAWDTENNWIIYMDDGIPDNDMLIVGAFSGESQLIPMQYTGVKDKNDVEIYEGDILRGKLANIDLDEPTVTHAVAVVNWSDVGFILVDAEEWVMGAKDEPAYILDDSKGWVVLEVVGNIYETPELLK